MKKVKLRKWVKVVLLSIFWLSMIFLLCDHDDNLILFLKNIVCVLICGISGIILLSYGYE